MSHKFVGFRSSATKQVCPACGGKGKRQVGSVDDTPLFQRCARCNGTGEVRAVLVKAVRGTDSVEYLRWNPDEPLDEPERYMRLSQTAKENIVSKATIKASVLAAVEDQLDVTDEELAIAARVGVSRDDLIQQKARDLLDDNERKLEHASTGLTAVEILAARIVR